MTGCETRTATPNASHARHIGCRATDFWNRNQENMRHSRIANRNAPANGRKQAKDPGIEESA